MTELTNEYLQKIIQDYIQDEWGIVSANQNTDDKYKQDYGADSLDILELYVYLENELEAHTDRAREILENIIDVDTFSDFTTSLIVRCFLEGINSPENGFNFSERYGGLRTAAKRSR